MPPTSLDEIHCLLTKGTANMLYSLYKISLLFEAYQRFALELSKTR